MMQKNYAFEEKQLKITKGQDFCTIFTFFEAQLPKFWRFESPESYYNYRFCQPLQNNCAYTTQYSLCLKNPVLHDSNDM